MKTTRIYGEWDEGIVVDNHMLKSIFLGYDENGKEIFENTRTDIGELVYRLKYKNDKECIHELLNLIKDILTKWNLKDKIDIVIPVPPSNKARKYQPVFEISKEISSFLNKSYKNDILIKVSNLQAKDKNNVANTIIQKHTFEKDSNILIIDDLYSTGNTLNETCKVLRKDPKVKKIYCLVLTRTKR